MTKFDDDPGAEIRSLVQRGPTSRLHGLLGTKASSASRQVLNVLLLLLLTWLPVVILSLIAGHAFTGRVRDPWFHDLEANGRLLFALPLFELAAGIVGASLGVQARSFLIMGLVPASQHSHFRAAQSAAVRMWNSKLADGALLVVSYGVTLWLRLGLGLGAGSSSWERVGSELTLAGWWHALVSLPILHFLLLRWVWLYFIWALFLFRVSRMDLKLTATHPDRVGGLGFLAWGVASFAPVLMAVSAMVSAGMADQIFHRGIRLADLKYDIGTFAIGAIVVLYVPLILFAPMLARCRFRGLLQFGKFALDHDRAFEKKWFEPGVNHGEDMLGSADIQALADAGAGYEHVNQMWLFPFDVKAFAVLAIAALLPFVALLGASSIKSIFLRLGELLI